MTIFHSRLSCHRSPVGAVEEGTPIHFRICLPRNLGCRAAYLCIQTDGNAGTDDSSMFWCGMEGRDHEWWECHYTPHTAGLYWYRLRVDTNTGNLPLGRGEYGEGVLGSDAMYQLTVYQKGFTTPSWLRGGIMYQIFPDRFSPSDKQKTGVPSGRTMRSDWGGQPEWRPNREGKVTNSDFFGGDLNGIEHRLDYLASLGVTCLYLNPIFESHSNHRYDTADYTKIDPLLGDEADFRRLCAAAKKRGIRILLDGVFSHTGSDSVYFNREGRYPGAGAYQSKASPYFSWYQFSRWPDQYESWWGFDTLPEVKETDFSFDRFINGPTGIVRRWLNAGASGWRLDVADELPDEFLENLRDAAKAENPDALVMGEVWEDASNKESYGYRRRYLLGSQLDSVMNYPFCDAILSFVRDGDARMTMEKIERIVEHYPPQVLHLLMNHIGTHDTERAITLLAGEPSYGRGREWQSSAFLSPEQRILGCNRLKLASFLQYTLPGVPCVYYGDEAGMEGYRDPFNRGCYPWGKEDHELIDWYRSLGKIRRRCAAFAEGNFIPLFGEGDLLLFLRRSFDQTVLCGLNRGISRQDVSLPEYLNGFTFHSFLGKPPTDGVLALEPMSCSLAVVS